MEEITRPLGYIYSNCYYLEIELSEWKGSVSYGLGADISLPPCLATGIWNLVPKATSGPKSRGASLGTKLWRHVQRYCAQFLAFMVIYGNSVLWVFCLRNRKNPRISNNNKISFEKSNGQILEIKTVIWEIKRTNFGNQKCHLRKLEVIWRFRDFWA